MLLIVILHGNANKLDNKTADYYKNPDNFSKAVPIAKGGTGMTSIATQKINCTIVTGVINTKAYVMYNPLVRQCVLFVNSSSMFNKENVIIANIPQLYRPKESVSTSFAVSPGAGEMRVNTNGNIEIITPEAYLPNVFVDGQLTWFI